MDISESDSLKKAFEIAMEGTGHPDVVIIECPECHVVYQLQVNTMNPVCEHLKRLLSEKRNS